ncbi:permease-like cell division protein FtsX [Gracilibacillus alcaliphilus]|uniref:permease-like cell division protein FtsX n=1 Tax=Gracilibacillus alcaliphilus TaxID=1401441 RepID=UPI00195EE912|nr:permease-like cell division protein FtsX [Gracilibacillus alcaliphilus]MBM7675992.1 cell division transport system permease protein [Gracilibacillus alcaliphilus]
MKFRTLGRHIKEGAKNTWRNGWMTVASVGAVTTTLILVGVFLVLMLNLNHIADELEQDVQIKALVSLTTEEEDISTIEENIENIRGIDEIEFLTKEEELANLVESFGEQGQAWELYEQDNPLNDVFVISATDPQDTERIAQEIEGIDHIDRVNYGQEYVDTLFQFNNYARNVGLVLIVALVFTAIFLISNTIKITILARKKEIGIMKLVGATNSFIRLPFFVEGLLLGILGSLVPIGIILGGYYYLTQNLVVFQEFNFIKILPFFPFALQVAAIIIGIGATIGVWGSLMSVRKFLKV